VTREPEHFDWRSDDERWSLPQPTLPPETDPRPKAEGPGHPLVSVLTGLTGAWTLAGGICYAILWDAYSSFFQAFGLTPQEVGYSRETLLIRAAVFGLFLVVLITAVLGMILIGLWVAWDHVHRDMVASTALFCAALGIVGGLSWLVNSYEDGAPLVPGALFMCLLGLVVGLFVGVLSRPSPGEGTSPSRLIAVVLSGFVILLGNALLVILLFSTAVPPAVELLLFGVVNLVLAERLGRTESGWFRPFAGVPDADRPSLREAFGRRRKPVLLWVALTFVIALAWAVPNSLTWSRQRFDEGQRTVESGYYTPSALVSYSVRPAYIYVVDPARDPLKVCGDRSYAASLIAVEGNGWWMLLRPARQPEPQWARVVWLPRDKYLVDLLPMVRLPDREPKAGKPADEAPGPEPYSWQTAACG
jgi:hypothetical protein